ncbi:hypothetical protein U14_04406 [Candidatus Moduliflexus flocculans]|uniref:Uncharacterized protein n=1 Tax=Candidatus Moduliflexus flocculans TaxID=1499966 RepID=A0A0S6W4K4_9BACT|nr:hypothetical protein U14_04406 [Candidatus Moduliflexus flocculans]
MQTMSLTVELPKIDVLFLEEYVKQHQLSMSGLISDLIEQFRASEQYVLHPEIHEILGIVPGDVDAKQEYYDYMEKKHQ